MYPNLQTPKAQLFGKHSYSPKLCDLGHGCRSV